MFIVKAIQPQFLLHTFQCIPFFIWKYQQIKLIIFQMNGFFQIFHLLLDNFRIYQIQKLGNILQIYLIFQIVQAESIACSKLNVLIQNEAKAKQLDCQG
ncbi:hypothetical protein pb186bvf_012413 [Paramecium bursaria]